MNLLSGIRENPKSALRLFVLCAVLPMASCSDPAGRTMQEHARSYCEDYGKASAGHFLQPGTLEIREIQLDERGWLYRFVNNFVQPRDSRFAHVFECRFQVVYSDSRHEGSALLLFIKNREFAEYTQWEDIQVLDMGEVAAENETFYIVVKYLKFDDDLMHLSKR